LSFAVYLITDPAYDVIHATRAALSGAQPGEVAVMARDKKACAREHAALCRALLPICRDRGAPLIVNGRCDIARAVGADGVHLPEAGLETVEARALLGPEALIGASRHGPRRPSERGAPDLVTLSPVGAVINKSPPLGVHGFARHAASYGCDVYALGGVTVAQVPALVDAGARGVAVIRAVYASEDPAAALEKLVSAVRSTRR